MEDKNKNQTEWEALLYRLQKVFDPRYVVRDGVWRIVVALVLTAAGTILSGFLLFLIGLFTGKIHL